MKRLLCVLLFAAACRLVAAPLPALDLTVSKYLGTTSRGNIMIDRTVPYAGAHLGGVHVDTSKTTPRFYVWDTLNNRVLGFNGFKASNLTNNFPGADIVLGQPALYDANAANGDSTSYTQPTAATLALVQYPWVNSTAETPTSGMMATDTNGNFYIVDKCNNRVLKYNDPFTTDQSADDVWGQVNFTSRVYGTTASNLYILQTQENGAGTFSTGVDVEPDGTLWVADGVNNRVLRFFQGAKIANLVLGQTLFTTRTSGTGLNQMYKPQGVRRHPKTGEIFVLDGESDGVGAPCRMLVFASNAVSGASALRVFGTNTEINVDNWATNRTLKEARGFAFDPFDTNMLWVCDGAHGRILKFNHRTGAVMDWIGYRTTNHYGTHAGGDGRYQRPDGTAGVIRQPDGDCGFDNNSNFYFTAQYGSAPIVRIPMPLTRNGLYLTAENGNWVRSSGEMMKRGMNQISGRTMRDFYGMSRWGTQLYVNDGQNCRLLVWTNYPAATTFQSADLVIGQTTLTNNDAGGTFEGRGPAAHSVGSNFLFVATTAKLFVFQLPITNGGRSYAPYKTLDSGSAGSGSFVWDDDNSTAYFNFAGIAYDAVSNCLWVGNNDIRQLIVNNVTNGTKRVLRIKNPLGTTPLRIDLVIGQTHKTNYIANHGLGNGGGSYSADDKGVAQPNQLALDNYGNLYVVDGSYEGRDDGFNDCGNLRVLRFNASVLKKWGGTNMFWLPAASGVFCKTSMTATREEVQAANRPNCPIFVSFGQSPTNDMILSVDGYHNAQGERVFYYGAPHVGTGAIAPTQVISTFFGQAAVSVKDATSIILQDHTWCRVMFHVARATAPCVDITNATVTQTSATTALGGTNANIVGSMRWFSDSGGAGTLAAASPWQVASVSLAYGANLITVSGTNTAGDVGSDTLTITRDYPGGGTPTLAITNTPQTVTNAVTTGALGGTANQHVVGRISWANDRGGSGSITSAPSWVITNIPLSLAANVITVSGTNAAGLASSASSTIFRDYPAGQGTPTLTITNAPQTFAMNVTTCALGGTANLHVVGRISWANTTRGGSGSILAALNWVITGIPLGSGANIITVTGTNVYGSNVVAAITMTRTPGPGEGPPYVAITTPATDVDVDTTALNINGTNSQVVGIMQWDNGAVSNGTIRAVTPWVISNVPLQQGENIIAVSGTNVYGEGATSSVSIMRGDVAITDTTWQVLCTTNGLGYAGVGTGLRMNERSTLVKNYDIDGYVYLQGFAAAGNPRTQSIWRVRATATTTTATNGWALVAGGIPCNDQGGEEGQQWIKCSNVFYSSQWCQFGIPNGSPWYWSWYGFYTTNAAGAPAVMLDQAATPLIERATGDDYPGGARNLGGILAWSNVNHLTAVCATRDGNGLDAQVRRWNGYASLSTLFEKECESINTPYSTCVMDSQLNGRAYFLAAGNSYIWCATNLYAGVYTITNVFRFRQLPGTVTPDSIVDLALLNHPNFMSNQLLAVSVYSGARKCYLYNAHPLLANLGPLDITPPVGLDQYRNTLAAQGGYLFMSYDAGSEAPGLMRLSLLNYNLQSIGVPEPGTLLLLLAPPTLCLRQRLATRTPRFAV